MGSSEIKNEDEKPATLKRVLSIAFSTALVVSIFANAIWFGYKLKDDRQIRRANDSLEIVKLKLEIELKKIQLGK